METLLGLALLSACLVLYRRLQPDGRTAQLMRKYDAAGTLIVVGLVAGVAFGSAFLVHGVVKYL